VVREPQESSVKVPQEQPVFWRVSSDAEKAREKMARRERRVRGRERNIIMVSSYIIAQQVLMRIRLDREARLDGSNSGKCWDRSFICFPTPSPLFAVRHHNSISQEAPSTVSNYFQIGSSTLDSRSPSSAWNCLG
jgi:hypothetical protein